MAANSWGVDVAGYVQAQLSNRQNGWSATSISPGDLPIPASFITPEKVAAEAISAGPTQTKTFSVSDFLTKEAPLNDPALASRGFASSPTSVPKTVGASISAYTNFPAPAFLTDAVSQLNETQSLRAVQQAEYREKLLEATLGGNYLAAEALRATSVQPGTSVTFGSAVQNPQIGQAALQTSAAAAAESRVRTDALRSATNQETALRRQLADVERQLGSLPGQQYGFTPLGIGGDTGMSRANLQSEQRRIQRELEKMRANLATGGAYRPTGYVPTPVF